MRLMMVRVLFVLMCFDAASAIAAEVKLPADVAKFIERREGCEHFLGEIPEASEKQRMREVNREIRKLCTGTDKQLARLKRKYAHNQIVMQRLSEFEEKIGFSTK